MMKITQAILLLVGLLSLTQAKSLYDPYKSYVTIMNNKNFDAQVTNNRAKGISIVHFYKEGGKVYIGTFQSVLTYILTYRWFIQDIGRSV